MPRIWISFLRTILGGKSIRYVPGAIAWHEHRHSYQDLRWQLFTYGAGFSALLTKWSLQDFRIALDLLRLAPRVVTSRLRTGQPEDGGKPSPLKEPAPLGTARTSFTGRCLRPQCPTTFDDTRLSEIMKLFSQELDKTQCGRALSWSDPSTFMTEGFADLDSKGRLLVISPHSR